MERKVIIFKPNGAPIPGACVTINDTKVDVVDNIIYLGHRMNDNIYEVDLSKCVEDFNRQCNMFMADFKYTSSYMRNILFQKYCMSFYGSQVIPLWDSKIEMLYKSWRIAVSRVWRLPWKTYCCLLPNLVGCMSPELCFAKRCIKFINMALNSLNSTVKTISNMGLHGSHSIMGNNYRFLQTRLNMCQGKVLPRWDDVCKDESETI